MPRQSIRRQESFLQKIHVVLKEIIMQEKVNIVDAHVHD